MAVETTDNFRVTDADKIRALTATEYATTAPKPTDNQPAPAVIAR